MKTRIWCEFTSPKDVCRDFVLDLFKKYNVTLNYKLEYGQLNEDFLNMIRTYNENEIPVAIWATLSDDMGYWINEWNAHHFDKYVRDLVESLEKENLKISGICIDLESPLHDIKKITLPSTKLDPCRAYAKMLTYNLNKKRYNKAKEILSGTANYIGEKGLESFATCLRHCYYDLKFNTEVIQNALEIPVFDVPWDKINLQYYATMIKNEMKKVKKVDVDYLIYHQVSYLNEKLNGKITVSVGVTNVGKLGNEPYYESLEEFEKDMGILKECNIDDFSLFSLDGILEERKLENFLDTMHKAKPYKPSVCSRVVRNEALTQILMKLGKAYYSLMR